ncbi:uncharacterized protein LOC128899969 [Dryobates pubescens]|uniref:uncharacterized protein LOC128899969 n=1 Tax=Dryobates pubescens TaxID=118200 RepID=UPI0023B93170|nr:uncharacterized protein LOC128899969 [Dryobates pubescens]
MRRQQPSPLRGSGAAGAVRALGTAGHFFSSFSERLFGQKHRCAPVVGEVGVGRVTPSALRLPSPDVPGAAVRSPLSPTAKERRKSSGLMGRTKTILSSPLDPSLPAAFPSLGSVPDTREGRAGAAPAESCPVPAALQRPEEDAAPRGPDPKLKGVVEEFLLPCWLCSAVDACFLEPGCVAEAGEGSVRYSELWGEPMKVGSPNFLIPAYN